MVGERFASNKATRCTNPLFCSMMSMIMTITQMEAVIIIVTSMDLDSLIPGDLLTLPRFVVRHSHG